MHLEERKLDPYIIEYQKLCSDVLSFIKSLPKQTLLGGESIETRHHSIYEEFSTQLDNLRNKLIDIGIFNKTHNIDFPPWVPKYKNRAYNSILISKRLLWPLLPSINPVHDELPKTIDREIIKKYFNYWSQDKCAYFLKLSAQSDLYADKEFTIDQFQFFKNPSGDYSISYPAQGFLELRHHESWVHSQDALKRLVAAFRLANKMLGIRAIYFESDDGLAHIAQYQFYHCKKHHSLSLQSAHNSVHISSKESEQIKDIYTKLTNLDIRLINKFNMMLYYTDPHDQIINIYIFLEALMEKCIKPKKKDISTWVSEYFPEDDKRLVKDHIYFGKLVRNQIAHSGVEYDEAIENTLEKKKAPSKDMISNLQTIPDHIEILLISDLISYIKYAFCEILKECNNTS